MRCTSWGYLWHLPCIRAPRTVHLRARPHRNMLWFPFVFFVSLITMRIYWKFMHETLIHFSIPDTLKLIEITHSSCATVLHPLHSINFRVNAFDGIECIRLQRVFNGRYKSHKDTAAWKNREKISLCSPSRSTGSRVFCAPKTSELYGNFRVTELFHVRSTENAGVNNNVWIMVILWLWFMCLFSFFTNFHIKHFYCAKSCNNKKGTLVYRNQ